MYNFYLVYFLNLCKFCKKTINKLTKIINIQMPADKLPNIVNTVNPSPRYTKKKTTDSAKVG